MIRFYLKKMTQCFKFVTFDVTGTLLKLKKPIGQIYSEVAKIYGIRADQKTLTENWSKVWIYMNKNHPNFGLYSGLGWRSWWDSVVSLIFNSGRSSEIDNVSLKQISSELIRRFSTSQYWCLVDGSFELLESLRYKNIMVGVISNYDPRLHDVLEHIGIKKYFSFVITSYENTYTKPDPQIFRIAEKCFESIYNERFEKSSAIHIGDSFSLDYVGAKNAGWNSALFTDKNVKFLLGRDASVDTPRVFRSLLELNNFLCN